MTLEVFDLGKGKGEVYDDVFSEQPTKLEAQKEPVPRRFLV